MPSRILREGLLTSDRVALLSGDSERLYVRLLLIVDDFGLCDGRPEIIKARAFPLTPAVTCADITAWVDAVEGAKLGERYTVAGKPYLHIFDTRQRRRANTPKFPLPPALVGEPAPDDGHLSAERGPPRPRAEAGSKAGSKAESGVKRGKLPPMDPRPEFLPLEWEEFETHRQSIKKPMTELARSKAVKQLGEWALQGYDIAKIINSSIQNGWTGLFAKPEHKRRGAAGAPSREAIEAFLSRPHA